MQGKCRETEGKLKAMARKGGVREKKKKKPTKKDRSKIGARAKEKKGEARGGGGIRDREFHIKC